MKRVAIIICTLIILVTVIGLGKNWIVSEPTLPSITVNGKSVDVFHGSYCWRSLLGGKCVDMASPPDIIKDHGSAPNKIPSEAILTIKYKNKPQSGSMGANNLWISEDQLEEVHMNDNQLIAPKEKGVYVYDVHARWEEGSASFVFSVEVE